LEELEEIFSSDVECWYNLKIITRIESHVASINISVLINWTT
jgi:hypothetical protein